MCAYVYVCVCVYACVPAERQRPVTPLGRQTHRVGRVRACNTVYTLPHAGKHNATSVTLRAFRMGQHAVCGENSQVSHLHVHGKGCRRSTQRSNRCGQYGQALSGIHVGVVGEGHVHRGTVVGQAVYRVRTDVPKRLSLQQDTQEKRVCAWQTNAWASQSHGGTKEV
jgi:hypothetical protein